MSVLERSWLGCPVRSSGLRVRRGTSPNCQFAHPATHAGAAVTAIRAGIEYLINDERAKRNGI